MPLPEKSLPTQDFVALDEIKQETIVLRGGGLRKILLVTGLNFDLKSEEEQELIIYAFQNFLNGLNFAVQIFIHSRKLKVERYLEQLAARQQAEPTELLKNIIDQYRLFIESFVGRNAVMDKKFLVVVPFDPLPFLPAGRSLLKKISRLWRKIPVTSLGGDQEEIFHRYLQQLDQRLDQVITGITNIGLRAVPLNEAELTELFYDLYNPEAKEKTAAPVTHG